MFSRYKFNFRVYVPDFSLEREEAEDLIKRHGGRVTGSVSKKTVTKIYLILAAYKISYI